MPIWLTSLAGGLLNGVGSSIGAAAGKAIQWVPGPGQYRRGKIHEITHKMLDIQNAKPFDSAKYELLRAERDKLEADAENAGQ